MTYALDTVTVIEMEALGHEQKSNFAMVENISGQKDLFLRRVFAQREVVELLVLLGAHVVLQANEIEVRREKDHRVIVGRRVEAWQDVFDEIVESQRWIVDGHSLKDLLEHGQRTNAPVRGKVRPDGTLARIVAGEPMEQAEKHGTGERRDDDQLTVESCPAVQTPRTYAREVDRRRGLGGQTVEILQDVKEMIEVLHGENVQLIDVDAFDRREKVGDGRGRVARRAGIAIGFVVRFRLVRAGITLSLATTFLEQRPKAHR